MSEAGSASETDHRRRLRIRGTVQGVGFRPFVHRLAHELGLTGSVGNDGDGVWCDLQGPAAVLATAAERIRTEHPPLAVITAMEASPLPLVPGEREFTVKATVATDALGPALIPPDVATCTSCLAEVLDPGDRRARYPFTCCTDCGPRYTVVRALPYDRERTTLADFPLCTECHAEYGDPNDRRFHAEAVCCAACGPRLGLLTPVETVVDGALERATELLVAGSIVAVKGLGGYQLVCRADSDATVRRLRERKHRDEKPFALLVPDVELALELADLSALDIRSLRGPEAPIVLARVRAESVVANGVAPGTGLLGLMLPASALHALLVKGAGFPLVCTSGNLAEEPIVTDDDHARAWLGGLADAVLTHDRRIERRADDSVGQVVHGEFQLLRRARGYAPRPIALMADGPVVLGVGAELKNTVCLATGRQALMTVHLGDLDNALALHSFEAAIADLLHLTGLAPELIVHDHHPEYLSSKFAASQDLAPTLAVQHHHAHLASCLMDNRHEGPAIGVTFDGIGWGTDGVAWGGELLVGDASAVERFAHLAPVTMPGGIEAIRHPWRMAVAHLVGADEADISGLEMLDRHSDWDDVAELCRTPGQLQTTSVGRLFDAVAALCGVRDSVSYEGQAAIGLEQIAWDTPASYDFVIEPSELRTIGTEPFKFDAEPVVRAIVSDLRARVDVAEIAGRFHNAVAAVAVVGCELARESHGLESVVLSGGVFQNRVLVELVIPRLEQAGFSVLRHRQVPTNDGGISLGQVAIGRAHLLRTWTRR